MTNNVVSESHVHASAGQADEPVVRPRNGLKAKILQWLFDHSEIFLSVLRDIAPIIVLKKKKIAIVTRYDDVKEVFLADDVFGVPYAEKLNVITGGVPFILGMEDSSLYRHKLEMMHQIMPSHDIDTRLAPATQLAAERIVGDASNGCMDTLKLSRDVTFKVFLDYFGVPEPANGNIMLWSTRLFESIFHVGKPEPELDNEVRVYAPALLAHVEKTIEERKAGREARKAAGKEPDDVLGRCLDLQAQGVEGFSDLEIRGTLAGFIVAGLPQPAMVLPKVVEQLLRRSKMLAEAQEAARRNDDDALAKYVFEAMRFDPLAPFLKRIAKREHILADSTFRSKKIEPGMSVFFLFASAMMDGRRVPNPKTFNPDRPPNNYILFGYGLHQCFGIHINKRLLPLMLKPLLKRHGLRRASGPEGHLRKQSVFPDRLTVCFDRDRPVVGSTAPHIGQPISHFSS
jgi:cytochrome P450